MGNYNAQYESYYSGIIKKTRAGNRYSSASNNPETFRLDKNYFIKRLMRELIGVFVLFVFVLFCRAVKTPDTVVVYNYSKMVVNEKYDYNQIISSIKKLKLSDIQSKSLEWMNNLKVKLSGEKTLQDTINEGFILPVDGNIITHYGEITDPVTKEKIFNKGIDFDVKEGTTVKASFDGKITECSEDGNTGKFIVIDHGNGIETKYGDLSEVTVKKGDLVKTGDTIGKSGKSGKGSSQKLHFELMYLGENKNVEEYFTLNK